MNIHTRTSGTVQLGIMQEIGTSGRMKFVKLTECRVTDGSISVVASHPWIGKRVLWLQWPDGSFEMLDEKYACYPRRIAEDCQHDTINVVARFRACNI